MTASISSCASCESRRTVSEHRFSALEIRRCPDCTHREAQHYAESSKEDYHHQYSIDFLKSLEKTRVRQTKILFKLLRSHIPDVSHLLDIGCGRGWFLQSCKGEGVPFIAGVDTSAVAIEELSKNSIEGVLIREETLSSDEQVRDMLLRQLSFQPRIFTFLDVCEHFERHSVETCLRTFKDLPQNKKPWILIKVPTSSGLLFKLARFLANYGLQGPLRQLYQVGTFPPHFHYFSNASLRTFCGRLGFEIVAELSDPDVEADAFYERVKALQRLPRILIYFLGLLFCSIARITQTGDARIVLLHPAQ